MKFLKICTYFILTFLLLIILYFTYILSDFYRFKYPDMNSRAMEKYKKRLEVAMRYIDNFYNNQKRLPTDFEIFHAKGDDGSSLLGIFYCTIENGFEFEDDFDKHKDGYILGVWTGSKIIYYRSWDKKYLTYLDWRKYWSLKNAPDPMELYWNTGEKEFTAELIVNPIKKKCLLRIANITYDAFLFYLPTLEEMSTPPYLGTLFILWPRSKNDEWPNVRIMEFDLGFNKLDLNQKEEFWRDIQLKKKRFFVEFHYVNMKKIKKINCHNPKQYYNLRTYARREMEPMLEEDWIKRREALNLSTNLHELDVK